MYTGAYNYYGYTLVPSQKERRWHIYEDEYATREVGKEEIFVSWIEAEMFIDELIKEEE